MVSCSKDGTVVTTTLNSGKYLRTIQFNSASESLLSIGAISNTSTENNNNNNDNDNVDVGSDQNIQMAEDSNSSSLIGDKNDISKYVNVGKARREFLFKLCSGVPKEAIISHSGYFAVHLSLGEKSTIAFFDQNMNIMAVRQAGSKKKTRSNFNNNSKKQIEKDLTLKKEGDNNQVEGDDEDEEGTIEIQEITDDKKQVNSKKKHKKIIRKSSSVAAISANESDGGIKCWSFFELPDGRMFLIELLRNKSLRMVTVPDFELLWQDKYFNKDISVIHLVQDPLCFLMGTTEGYVYQLSF